MRKSKHYNNNGKQRILVYLLVIIIVLVSKQGCSIWKSKNEQSLNPTQSKVMYSAPVYNGEDITTNMPGEPNLSNKDDWKRGMSSIQSTIDLVDVVMLRLSLDLKQCQLRREVRLVW